MEDIGVGGKICITVIALCALLALVFFLWELLRNIGIIASDQMDLRLSNMRAEQYNDYKQQMVIGAQVSSAIRLLERNDMCIIVTTSKQLDSEQAFCYGQLADTARKSYSNSLPYYVLSAKFVPTKDSAGLCISVSPDKNEDLRIITDESSDGFIEPTGRFFSELLYDIDGEVAGVYFKQMR